MKQNRKTRLCRTRFQSRPSRLITCILIWCVISIPMLSIADDDFIIVLDQSGSMREKVPGDPKKGYEQDPLQADKSKGAIDALHQVAKDLLKEEDYFALITFGDKADLSLSQQLSYPHERDLFTRQIEQLQFKDKKTDILAGLKKATDVLVKMNTPHRRKILVMVTDGINEPPDDSPYASPAAQERAYQELREIFEKNNWDIALVGLGAYTDIAEIARRLNLPDSNAIIMSQLRDSGDITGRLRDIVGAMQAARVEMETKVLKIRLQPKLRGGYDIAEDTLTLKSFYPTEVNIQLDPQAPFQLEGGEMLQVTVTPLQFKLAPQKSAAFTLRFEFTGQRPADGRISGRFAFRFTNASTQFFPQDGTFEVILPSWWEVYGLLATAAIIGVLILLSLLIWLIRRSTVPEVRVTVTANYQSLGETMTLRKKDTFTIANEDFSGRSVSAKGLSCKIAARVKYLGYRKFEVTAVDAKILIDNNEADRLVVKLDQLFDLQDSAGKKLRSIAITTPGKGGSDPFGGGSKGSDIF